MSELVVEGLSKSFGGVAAVRDVSFRAKSGMCTAVIGPNGAGKSTLISLISGAGKADAGSVRLDGKEMFGRSERHIARSGIIRSFQSGGEFVRLTALESVLIGARISYQEGLREALMGKRRSQKAEARYVDLALELLDGFGLSAHVNSPMGTLSGGERRLVEIARILAAKPRVILLDEPTAGVHDVMISRLERHIRKIVEDEVIVVIIEHELGLVERLSDRIVMMANGTVLREADTLDELRQDPEVVAAYFGRAVTK